MIIHFSKDGEPVLLEILDAKDFILNSLSSVVKEKRSSDSMKMENGTVFFKLGTTTLFHSHIIPINSPNYRIKDKMKRVVKKQKPC